MGSPWKMFTQTQGQELIDNTNHTWTTIKGVNGRKFTSKTDSSKYIFLPAGGWYEFNRCYQESITGNFSSTKCYSNSNATNLIFDSTNITCDTTRSTGRYYGSSVRAI